MDTGRKYNTDDDELVQRLREAIQRSQFLIAKAKELKQQTDRLNSEKPKARSS
ncbi:MAG TPA: hypothetical protein VMU61_17065 [Candidatus Aquilonibacter sp.]|nr:hypothetical protein [Candidatus Aquilonibacter sp.]